VVGVWFRCLEFLNDEKTHDEAVEIMARRIEARPADLEANLKGTRLLDGKGNLEALKKGETLKSVHGSMKNAQAFYLKHKVYNEAQDIDKYVDSSLVKEVLDKK
jgi:NitT/TauT family transport system substrate-binding protein